MWPAILLIGGGVVLVAFLIYFIRRPKDIMVPPKHEEESPAMKAAPKRGYVETPHRSVSASYRDEIPRSSSVRPFRNERRPAETGPDLLTTLLVVDALTPDHHTAHDHDHSFHGGESGGAGASGDFDHEADKHHGLDSDNTRDHDFHSHDSDFHSHDSDFHSHDSSDFGRVFRWV